MLENDALISAGVGSAGDSGVSGDCAFEGNGRVPRAPRFAAIVDGKLRPLDSDDESDGHSLSLMLVPTVTVLGTKSALGAARARCPVELENPGRGPILVWA